MKDVDIFIFSQGIPKIYPKSEEYKLVSIEKIEEPCDIEKICVGDYDDPILKMEHAYSECARIHALWKNYPLKKYVGLNHYRRYFRFFDNVPDLDEIFKEHDAIYDNFDIGWPNIWTNYKGCHNIEDLKRCFEIIKRDFPEFVPDAEAVFDSKFFVPCNIFLVTRETFLKWCEFVFGVLDKYNEEMGFKTDLDVCNHVVNNMVAYVDGKGDPNDKTDYQTRIHAFLSERLSSIFFHHTVKNPYYEDMVLTELRHNFEKEYFKQYEKQNIGNNS